VKARALGVRAALPAVLAAEAVALAAFVVLPPAAAGWWPGATITAVALMLLVLTVYRRNAPGWVAAALRWRSRRNKPAAAGAAIDVPHGNIVCGVRVEPSEAITMIQVSGRAYTPTFLQGSTLSLTTNVLPLRLLAGLLDQSGALKLAGIDVVSAGHRVRRGDGYPPLYSSLLADRPAAGQRSTRLIVRVDLPHSVPALAYRKSIGAAAAAATERIINALLQDGVRASALGAAELDGALSELSAHLATAPAAPPDDGGDTGGGGSDDPAPARGGPAGAARTVARRAQVGWRTVKAHPGFLTTYYFSPEDITTAALHRMWSLRADGVVTVICLSKDRYTSAADGDGPVMVSAIVRTNDPQAPSQPPTLFLNPLPGDQYAATLRAAPMTRRPLHIPARPLGEPTDLQIPIGSTGILVGAALRDDSQSGLPVHRDDLVMWSLTDPQRATRIVMDTGEFYVRQLLIRAAAVGERIAIYSDQPGRWSSLSQPNIAVVQRGSPPQFVPSIIVNDRPTTPPSAGLSSTVITVGSGRHAGPKPDMYFEQTSRETVRISTDVLAFDVAIVAFRQEQAWTGLGAPQRRPAERAVRR